MLRLAADRSFAQHSRGQPGLVEEVGDQEAQHAGHLADER